MNTYLLIIIISLIVFSNGIAQSTEDVSKLRSFSVYQVGIASTYKKAMVYSKLLNSGDEYFQEFTFQLNGRTNLNRTFSLGAKFFSIFNISNETYRKEWFFMSGVSLHTKTFRYAKNPVAIEIGLLYGNYCTCGVDIPFKYNAGYVDIGVEYMLRLNRYFFIDFNLNFYTIFTPTYVPNFPALTTLITNPVYGIGLVYQFR